MSRNASKRRKNHKKKDVPRCGICGSPLIPIKEWARLHYDDIVSGKIPEPKFWAETKAAIDEERKKGK
jgi:hypothetical protein